MKKLILINVLIWACIVAYGADLLPIQRNPITTNTPLGMTNIVAAIASQSAPGGVASNVYYLIQGTNTYISTNAQAIRVDVPKGAGISTNGFATTNYVNAVVLTNGASFPSILTNRYYWLASTGTNDYEADVGAFGGEHLALYQSSNGTNWSLCVSNVYVDPDSYTNNSFGPFAREGALQYDGTRFWTVYNFDPYNTNGTAQGLGLAWSYDLTNWFRKAVIYPYGTTNFGAMFAATWYWEGGTNYLVGCYNTGAVATAKNVFVIRRLDDSYTNWSAAQVIIGASTNTGKWDATITKVGSQYQLYTGSGYIWTNSTGIYSRWNRWIAAENSLQGDIGFGWEAPQIINFGGNHLWYYENTGGPNRAMQIAESSNGGLTWTDISANLTGTGGVFPPWYGPGMLYNVNAVSNTIVNASGAAQLSEALKGTLVGSKISAAFAGDGSQLTNLLTSVSIREFGAVGNGVTDDTAAFQAAFDAMSNSKKILSITRPDNFYRITKTVYIRNSTRISGGDNDYESGLNPSIHFEGTGACIGITNWDINGIEIINLSVRGPGKNTSTIGILSQPAGMLPGGVATSAINGIHMERCLFDQFGIMFQGVGTGNSMFESNFPRNCRVGFWFSVANSLSVAFRNSNGSGSTDTNFIFDAGTFDITAGDINGGVGIVATNGAHVTLKNVNCEPSTAPTLGGQPVPFIIVDAAYINIDTIRFLNAPGDARYAVSSTNASLVCIDGLWGSAASFGPGNNGVMFSDSGQYGYGTFYSKSPMWGNNWQGYLVTNVSSATSYRTTRTPQLSSNLGWAAGFGDATHWNASWIETYGTMDRNLFVIRTNTGAYGVLDQWQYHADVINSVVPQNSKSNYFSKPQQIYDSSGSQLLTLAGGYGGAAGGPELLFDMGGAYTPPWHGAKIQSVYDTDTGWATMLKFFVNATTQVTAPYQTNLTQVAVLDSVTGMVLNAGSYVGNASGLSNLSIAGISAGGTPSASTYLRGDGTWSTATGGGGISAQDATNAAIGVVKSNTFGFATNSAVVKNTGSNYVQGWSLTSEGDSIQIDADSLYLQGNSLGNTFIGGLLYANGAGVSNVVAKYVANQNLTNWSLLATNTFDWKYQTGASALTNLATGAAVFNVRAFGATGNGVTDDGAAITNAIYSAFTNGGGEVYFPQGKYICGIQLRIPTNTYGPNQPTIRFRGDGIARSGGWWTNTPAALSRLVLRSSTAPGKIVTLGDGLFESRDMQFEDDTDGTAPFVFTTQTSLRLVNNAFVGKSNSPPVQDAIILGGTDTAGAAGKTTDNFRGYGTIISDNWFSWIQRAAWFKTFANGIQFVNNTVWWTCGGSNALQITGAGPADATYPATPSVGNYIAGNLFEMYSIASPNTYSYAIVLSNAVMNTFVGNQFWDAFSGNNLAYYKIDNSTNNVFLDGPHNGNITEFTGNSVAQNTFISGQRVVSQSYYGLNSGLTNSSGSALVDWPAVHTNVALVSTSASLSGTNLTVDWSKPGESWTASTNLFLSTQSNQSAGLVDQKVIAIKGSANNFKLNFGMVTNLYGAWTTNGVVLGNSNSPYVLTLWRLGTTGTEAAILQPPNN